MKILTIKFSQVVIEQYHRK